MSLLLLLGGASGTVTVVNGTLAGTAATSGSLVRTFPTVAPYTATYALDTARTYRPDNRGSYVRDYRIANSREAP